MIPKIVKVTTRRQLKEFVRFPNRMYKGSPYYVPTLESGDMDALDRNKNHAFEVCKAEYWLAYDRDGAVVGRIAGINNSQYNMKVGQKIARFGFMDFVDDKDVSRTLLDTAREWALSEGMEIMDGPLGFLEFDAAGVLVEGFDELPTAYGKYNFPYYEQHLLDYGFSKETDWVEYRIDITEGLPSVYSRVSNIILERLGLHVARLGSKKDLVPYFDDIFNLMNRAYSDLHGFSELSRGQIDDLKKQFLPYIDLRFVCVILDREDKVVSFGVCLPSLSEAMQKCGGKLLPFGFLHLIGALRKNEVLDALLVAVDIPYRSSGLISVLFYECFKGAREFGIKYVESTRELEDNARMQNCWKRLPHRLHKRARCYIMKISK